MIRLRFWHHASRLAAGTRALTLRLLLWHTKLHYWATRKAADANLRNLNRRATQRGQL